jgi:hypothetical protein
MELTHIETELKRNKAVFQNLFTGMSAAEYLWKPAQEKWCLLEVLCHLYDEEREDFRARVRHVLNTPDKPLEPIRPVEWVTERNYIEQDYAVMLSKFLEERDRSLDWLGRLKDPRWENAHVHPKLGKMTAAKFLANWLAHDYLHIRQIVKIKFDLLRHASGEDLDYAGTW